jgi:endonuclease/exonuclease/phosphatase family metal-dependent hydrolase
MTLRAQHSHLVHSRGMNASASAVRAALITLLALTMAGACTRPGETPPLRVMTYNIAAGHGDLDGIARAIRAEDPDIVALQEVDVRWSERSGFADQAAELGAALGMHVRFGAIYSMPSQAEFGLAILSREPIVEFTNHVIPRLSTQTEAAEPAPMPGFLEAVVRIGGERLHVFNTHLDYRADPRVREVQVARMLELMDEGSEPVILMGDLNARPDAAELQPLLAPFTDAWGIATGAGWTYPGAMPDRRIDYILLSDRFRVIDAHVPATRASDHRPVVADVRVSRQGVGN